MLLLACLLAAAAAAPATYDQRQDGEWNVRADVQNVVLLVAVPSFKKFPISLNDIYVKSLNAAKPEVQERADVQAMEAFVEPSTPYRVEIGGSDRYANGDGRAVEVVIAGRRRLESEQQAAEVHEEVKSEPQGAEDELKLIGATEQCGPDRERDPDTLMCRARASAPQEPPAAPETHPEELPVQKSPEVVPVST